MGLDVDEGAFKAGEMAIKGLEGALLVVAGAAVAAGAALIGITKHVADAAIESQKGAQRTGLTREAYEELAFAAEQTGTSVDQFERAMFLMSRTALGATEGSKELNYELGKMGVSVYGVGGKIKPTDQLLGDFADKFSQMPGSAEKVALAMRVFGKSGAGLLPFLNKGRDGLQALRDKAHEYGVVIDDEVLASAEEWRNANLDLEAAIKGLSNAIGGPLLKGAGELTKQLAEWIKNNRELIAQKIHKVVDAIKSVFEALWSVIQGVVFVVERLANAWQILAVILGGVVLAAIFANIAGIGTLVSWYGALGIASLAAGAKAVLAWLAAIAPLVLLGLAIAGLILIVEDLYTWFQGGESVFKDAYYTIKTWLVDKLSAAFDSLKEYFQGLWDWITGGITNVAKTIYDTIANAIKGAISALPFGIGDSILGAFGGGSSPTALVGSSVNAPGGISNANNQQTFNVNQTINASHGMDTKELADESAQKMQDFHYKTTSEAFEGIF